MIEAVDSDAMAHLIQRKIYGLLVELDPSSLDVLAAMTATFAEIAIMLGVDADTACRHLREAMDIGMSLPRRNQDAL